MRMTAAVAYKVGEPLSVEQVELEDPQQGEVLVRIVGAGVCHTDVGHARTGRAPMPMVFGHEGAGIVQKLGPGVDRVKVGDHVILTGVGSCGKCEYCVKGTPVMCTEFRPLMFGGTLKGGQRRLRNMKGQVLNHFFEQSSFAEYSVVP